MFSEKTGFSLGCPVFTGSLSGVDGRLMVIDFLLHSNLSNSFPVSNDTIVLVHLIHISLLRGDYFEETYASFFWFLLLPTFHISLMEYKLQTFLLRNNLSDSKLKSHFSRLNLLWLCSHFLTAIFSCIPLPRIEHVKPSHRTKFIITQRNKFPNRNSFPILDRHRSLPVWIILNKELKKTDLRKFVAS